MTVAINRVPLSSIGGGPRPVRTEIATIISRPAIRSAATFAEPSLPERGGPELSQGLAIALPVVLPLFSYSYR
jgi:hypothetical protein